MKELGAAKPYRLGEVNSTSSSIAEHIQLKQTSSVGTARWSSYSAIWSTLQPWHPSLTQSSSIRSQSGLTGLSLIPRAELDEMWKDTLLNQFHDVLPGTTISLAVGDALEIYARRMSEAQGLVESTLKHLVTPAASNPSSHIAFDPMRLYRHEVTTVDGEVTMLSSSGTGVCLVGQSTDSPRAYQEGDTHILENAHFRLTFSDGRIVSLIDRCVGRELIMSGPGAKDAGLLIYEDHPLQYDAWDVEIYHLDTVKPITFDKIEVAKGSPTRASLVATASFGSSAATLTVRQLQDTQCKS